jgi:hypothetical protein
MILRLLFLATPFILLGETSWNAKMQPPFAVSITVSSDQASVGSFVNLDAEFRYPSSYEIDPTGLMERFAFSLNPLNPQVSLYKPEASSLPAAGGTIATRLHLPFRPLSEGHLSISLKDVTFQPKDASQKPIEVETPAFTIEVLPKGKEESLLLAPLMPLEPEYPLGLTEANRKNLLEGPDWEREQQRLQRELSRHAFPWLALSILIGLAGIGWTAYLMREQLPSWSWKRKPSLSPLQKAEQSLSALMQQNLIDRGLQQQYAGSLSTILLESLQDLSGNPYVSFTTKEASFALAGDPNFSEVRDDIVAALTETDQIKFAKKEIPPDEADQLLQKVRSVIEQAGREKQELIP